MKTVLIFLLYILISQSCLANNSSAIKFDVIGQNYQLSQESILAHELLSFVGLTSGLEIRFAPSLAQETYQLPKILTESELLRWLANTFSTVQHYNQQQQLISLTILPKGQYQSESLILANDPINEGKAHKLEQTNETAKERFQLRLKEFDQQLQTLLQQQIERSIEREAKIKSRAKQRDQQKAEKQTVLANKMRSLKSSDPELYARMLEINQARYPGLEAEILITDH
jgi:hypothetical protein